jgi:adenosylcobinamide amidohydrolase
MSDGPHPNLTLGRHVDDDRELPVLVWRFDAPLLVASSAPVGGGIGLRGWALNAQVCRSYRRTDIDRHLESIAATNGCAGEGVGMLTATPVERFTHTCDTGVRVWATVGITLPTWAAAHAPVAESTPPGTINLVAVSPARLDAAALVNTIVTATEAKTQALLDCGVQGTGTASDAVCIACPVDGPAERFGGPRSHVGAALARAVYDAVAAGVARGDEP